jgi:hypothetical protein
VPSVQQLLKRCLEESPQQRLSAVAIWSKNKENAGRKCRLTFSRPGEYEVRFNYLGDMPNSTVDVLKEPES